MKATNEPVLIYMKDKLNDELTFIWTNFTLKVEKIRDESIGPDEARWKCTIPVYPLKRTQELVHIYVGKRGRPRAFLPWGISYLHKFYPEQKSLDLVYRIHAAEDGGPVGGESELRLHWDTTFQLSFPYIGDK